MAKELRIGVIGTGAIGQDHIQRINEKTQGARVVAVTDINKEVAEKLADQIGAQFFETGEALIQSPDVDAVVVTSWDPTHEKYVLEAIRNDKYVFCEKPLAVEIEGCRRIVDAEIAKGKKLVQVGFMRRYDRGYEELKLAIDSKEFGDVLMLHCTHRNPQVDESYNTPMAVENTAVHEVDVLRWLLQEDFVSVQVILPKKQTRHTHKDLHDPQIIILETVSGIHIDLEVFVNCQFGYDINCKVVCESGEIGLTDPAYISIKSGGKDYTGISPDWKQRFVTAYDHEFQLWIDSVKNERVDGPSAWDGYVASITTAACSKARDTGKKVAIQLDECPLLYNKNAVEIGK
jgi:myo-inositol 2-dehydrogenase / D-chiro-inositol 1-dehydrogenase